MKNLKLIIKSVLAAIAFLILGSESDSASWFPLWMASMAYLLYLAVPFIAKHHE